MDYAKKRELALGLVMLCAGLLYLLLTFNLPRKGVIDASFVPYVLGFAMSILGILQLMAARKATPPPARAEEAEPVDRPTVMKTVGLIVGYVAMLDYAGFPLMTMVYLYLQFVVLTPATRKVNHLTYVALAALAAALIYVTFRFGFDLMLPDGFMDF